MRRLMTGLLILALAATGLVAQDKPAGEMGGQDAEQRGQHQVDCEIGNHRPARGIELRQGRNIFAAMQQVCARKVVRIVEHWRYLDRNQRPDQREQQNAPHACRPMLCAHANLVPCVAGARNCCSGVDGRLTKLV